MPHALGMRSFTKKNTKIKEIINLLTKNEISQVPVIERNNCIGLVAESSILAFNDDASTKTAGDIMTESPPIITKNAKISVVKSLLQFYPIILIRDSEKLIGVITKADILKCLIA